MADTNLLPVTNSAYLCGYFTAGKEPILAPGRWNKCVYTTEERTNLNNYYFPEFAQCMADDLVMYTCPVEKDCLLAEGDTQVPFRVHDVRVWVAPFRLVLYAVHIRFENIDFNAVTKTLNSLRNCAYYSEIHRPFIETALTPVIELFRQSSLSAAPCTLESEGGLSPLVESGNKFKIFQILRMASYPTANGQQPTPISEPDLLLYDAGTLAPHTPFSTGINSPEYIAHILEGHKISVFAGWKGLAILDTFTLLATDTPEHVLGIWEKDYFEKIYIYQLFRKAFLYSVNLRYRRRSEDVALLEEQLDLFEQKYSYTAISYNFLPNIINSNIETSLATQRDYDQLDRMIGKEIEMRRDRAERKTNNFLTFLTCLAMFSAVYDFASLVNDSIGYDTVFPSSFYGFRFVSTTLLLIVIVVYLVFVRKK